MAFNPSEPRDPHSGKWTLEGIMKDLGALPQGGQGNRTSMRGVEIRRHQSGAYRVKIKGDARNYGTHAEAAKAVHGQNHTSAGVRHDAVREAAASGSVPGPSSREQAFRKLSASQGRGKSYGRRTQETEFRRGESLRKLGGITSAADDKAKVKREIAAIEEQIREMGQPASGYTAAELVDMRSADIRSQLAQDEKRIWVKVPSGSEVSMSPQTARELLKQRPSYSGSSPGHYAGGGAARSYAAMAQAKGMQGETARMSQEKDRLVVQMQGVAADYAREPEGPKKQRMYMKMVDLQRRINIMGGS